VWAAGLTVARCSIGFEMPDAKPYKPPYAFSVTIGENCARKMRTFIDLAEALKMDITDLMRQCNGKVSPSQALVKGLAKELEIDESFLNRLAEEVRKDLDSK
jgi:transcriptional regulator with XRE-family HTH domain